MYTCQKSYTYYTRKEYKMKKNIKNLTEELKEVQKINSYPIDLQTSSIFSIFSYKNRLRKQKKLETKIEKVNLSKQKIIEKYDNQIESWLNNLKINCRKYCRLEPKAIYKKEKNLYKLGYLSKKPLSPFKQNLKKFFSPIINLFKAIISKIPFYKLNPKKNIKNLAVNSTKYCIKSYRKLECFKAYAKKNLLESTLIKRITNIKQEALKQLDEESKIDIMNKTQNSDFFDSIKVNVSPELFSSKVEPNIKHKKEFSEDRIL